MIDKRRHVSHDEIEKADPVKTVILYPTQEVIRRLLSDNDRRTENLAETTVKDQIIQGVQKPFLNHLPYIQVRV